MTSGFNPWDEQAKQLLASHAPPHFAPDADEVAQHRCLLARHRERHRASDPAPRLLVLGATPELADLGLALGYRVLRVDSSPAMFDAARPREVGVDRRDEACLLADWRDLGAIPTGSVHAVVGDAALNNVADADMHQVLGELARIVPSGGVFSLKQIVFPSASDAAPELTEALNARRQGSLSWTDFRMLVRFWCFREAAYDPATHVLDAARVYDAVDAAEEECRWDASESAYLAKSRSRLRHTIYLDTVQERLLRSALGPCVRHHASDALHHRMFFPIYEASRA